MHHCIYLGVFLGCSFSYLPHSTARPTMPLPSKYIPKPPTGHQLYSHHVGLGLIVSCLGYHSELPSDLPILRLAPPIIQSHIAVRMIILNANWVATCIKLFNGFLFLEWNQNFLLCPVQAWLMILPPSTFPVFPCVTLCLASHPHIHWTLDRFWNTQGTPQPSGLCTYSSQCLKHPFLGSNDGWHLFISQASLCLNPASSGKS